MEGDHSATVPKDSKFAKTFATVFRASLGEGLIKKNHHVELKDGDLDGIVNGLTDTKEGKVSGEGGTSWRVF